MDNIAIRTEHLSKRYALGVINTGTFFRDLQVLLARRRGKPNPHAKLGYEYYDGPDSFWALKDLNLEIRQGERVGIIGRNGAGKSTLLKLISRISAPTEGVIKIRGKVASLLEVGTGFHKELTGRENIYLNGAILGMKKKKINRMLDEIIDFSGIERHIDTPVKRYSSGMFVRLGFAVAAHLDSDILIADEVLAVGDAKFQQKALGKMASISRDLGRTILFVSHNMAAVQALCETGILLDSGRVMLQGPVNDCLRTYNTGTLRGKASLWEGEDGDRNLLLTHASLVQSEGAIDLTVRFRINTSGLDYVYTMIVLNGDGERVCISSASDSLSDVEYARTCEAGDHELQLRMDVTIFASGEYYIEFDFAIHNLKRITKDDTKLYFEIFDQRRNRHPSITRMNCIKPKMDWIVTGKKQGR